MFAYREANAKSGGSLKPSFATVIIADFSEGTYFLHFISAGNFQSGKAQ
jgi:hypothetical protein